MAVTVMVMVIHLLPRLHFPFSSTSVPIHVPYIPDHIAHDVARWQLDVVVWTMRPEAQVKPLPSCGYFEMAIVLWHMASEGEGGTVLF
jgi:hypothetical protein